MSCRRGGFTLVEAIVVAVIIAILAAVAIPNYLGYVRSTRQTSALNLAQTAAAAANIYYRKTNQTIVANDLLPNSTKLNLSYNINQFTLSLNGRCIKATTSGVSDSATY